MAIWTTFLLGLSLSVGVPSQDQVQLVSQEPHAAPAAEPPLPAESLHVHAAQPGAVPMADACAVPVVTGCDAPSAGLCGVSTAGCPYCCSSPCCCCCKKMGCLDWLHFHSTCDLYPHYAYQPENHGYYYFRPYNWIHVDQHRSTIPGRDRRFPYSNLVLNDFYAQAKPELVRLEQANTDIAQPRRYREPMPMLEGLLQKK